MCCAHRTVCHCHISSTGVGRGGNECSSVGKLPARHADSFQFSPRQHLQVELGKTSGKLLPVTVQTSLSSVGSRRGLTCERRFLCSRSCRPCARRWCRGQVRCVSAFSLLLKPPGTERYVREVMTKDSIVPQVPPKALVLLGT